MIGGVRLWFPAVILSFSPIFLPRDFFIARCFEVPSKTSGTCGSNEADLISWKAASLLSTHPRSWSPTSQWLLLLLKPSVSQSSPKSPSPSAGFITISWTAFPRSAVSQNAKSRQNFCRDRSLRRSDSRPASASDAISLQNNRLLSMIQDTWYLRCPLSKKAIRGKIERGI